MTEGAAADHPVHAAAEGGRFRQVRALLDAEPGVINRQDHMGATPLHRAVLGRSRRVASLLLSRCRSALPLRRRAKDVYELPAAALRTNRYSPLGRREVGARPGVAERAQVAALVPDRTVPSPRAAAGRHQHGGWLIERGAPYDLTI